MGLWCHCRTILGNRQIGFGTGVRIIKFQR